jgi:hypothetical protein
MKSDNSAAAGARRARASTRFKWLAAVNRSLDLTPVQRAAAISIGLHFNITDGRCDPGYDAIARGTPYKRRAVITAVADLAKKGWIAITPSRGRHRNNIELTTPFNSAPVDAQLAVEPNGAQQEHVPCTRGAENGAQETDHVVELTSEKKRNREENMKGNREEKKDSPYSPQEMTEGQVLELRPRPFHSTQLQKSGQPSPVAKNVASENGFEEFWRIYPRKVGKGTARRAWAKAITGTSLEKITAAATRYASREFARMSAGENPDLRYTAHPATWLNAERWDDETMPTVGAPKTSPHGGRSIADLVAGSLGVSRKVE